MTSSGDPGDPGDMGDVGGQKPRDEAERKKRLAEVFGDVLPDTTSDERDDAPSGHAEESARDEWYRDQVPPHHG